MPEAMPRAVARRAAAARPSAPRQPAPGKVVVISDHDYRTARRASVHQIADAFVKLGHDVSFISVRYSLLSRMKADSRNFLWNRANAVELKNDIRCFLWRTPLHPFNPKIPWLNGLSASLYKAYGRAPCRFLDEELRAASLIVVESGLGATLLKRARNLNGSARIVYRASDDLVTVGVHPCVQSQLEAAARVVDQVCVTSRKMAHSFRWAGDRLFFVPHGIRKSDYPADCENPYRLALNAVSVGSMLFDADLVAHSAERFPQMWFHVIGAGRSFPAPCNVIQYPEMPFRETLPYIMHATVGIAPYRAAPNCDYLSDTSLKLMQYEYCGIPAVCPAFAAGNSPNRFAYDPGDRSTVAAAIEAALAHRDHVRPPQFLSWEDVARRLLRPRDFADAAM